MHKLTISSLAKNIKILNVSLWFPVNIVCNFKNILLFALQHILPNVIILCVYVKTRRCHCFGLATWTLDNSIYCSCIKFPSSQIRRSQPCCFKSQRSEVLSWHFQVWHTSIKTDTDIHTDNYVLRGNSSSNSSIEFSVSIHSLMVFYKYLYLCQSQLVGSLRGQPC